MADLLRRFPGTNDEIVDAEGNGLVANATKYGDNDMVVLLLKKGFDPNGRDKNGNTPLHYAMSGNFKKLIQTLIQMGADENA